MRSKVYSSEVEGRSTVKCPPCKIVDTVQMSIPPVDAGPTDLGRDMVLSMAGLLEILLAYANKI